MGLRIIKAKKVFDEVLMFEPQKLEVIDPELMNRMVRSEANNPDFKISEVVRNFTGLKEKEIQEVEIDLERRALEQLQGVQESAYQEAYKLGEDEGKKEAYEFHKKDIVKKLESIDQLFNTVSHLKEQLLNANENHIIQLVYHLAKLIARKEISQNQNDVILAVLSESLKLAHSEEKVRVHISEQQIDFLESLQKESGREMEFLKNLELVTDKNIEPGGCIISTNYGEVDARVAERAEQLWNTLKDTLPASKDVIES